MSIQLAAFSLCAADLEEAVESIAEAGFKQIALYFARGRLPCELESMTDAHASAIQAKLAARGLAGVRRLPHRGA